MRKKSIWKRVMCYLLTAGMVLDGAAVNLSVSSLVEAQAADELVYTEGSAAYYYQILSADCVGIIKYEGTDTVLQIPSEIDGMTVELIMDEAMKDNQTVQEVIIPDTVTQIGSRVFSGCTALKKVILPNSISVIERSTFENCKSLETIDIPESVIKIDGFAFYRCSSLKNVTLPDNLVSLGFDAFELCTSLESVNLPAKLSDFEEAVFCSCESLTNVVIEEGVEEIPQNTFTGCSALTEISIPQSVEKIGSYAFADTGLTSVDILNDNIWISTLAFGKDRDNSFVIRGNAETPAEANARKNGFIFQPLDGTYEKDYSDVEGCYEAALSNYDEAIAHLNEYYLEKYPDMALGIKYGTESDREFFKGVAKEIIEENPDIPIPEALYNWMNDNIAVAESGYQEYGYPTDVYNFRTADCEGNAELLCELLRCVDIPAVVFFGWTGDMENTVTEEMLENGKVTEHAWVMAYYDNQWQLLDSGMNRMISDREEICKWYYTSAVDEDIVIYSDNHNLNTIIRPTVCFKDGYYIGIDGEIDRPVGRGLVISPEGVKIQWSDLSGARWVDSGEQVIMEPGKEGWFVYGGDLRYLKKNTSILTQAFREIDGKTYYFDQNGYVFDISDLDGNYKVQRGCPVIEWGSSFQLLPVTADGEALSWATWQSSDESIATVDENGYVTVNEKTSGGSNYISISYGYYDFEFIVDDFVTEISLPEEVSLKAGEDMSLEMTTDKESVVFYNYIWESSDTETVTVDQTGKITALKPGVAEITVIHGDGSGLQAKTKVVVTSDQVNVQKDADGEGLYIEYSKNVLEEDVTLNTKSLTSEDEKYETIKENLKSDFKAFDIFLSNKDNEKVQPGGRVTVRIPCPDGFEGKSCKVYYLTEKGTYVDMKAVYSGGFLAFDTNHFSTYLVTEAEVEEAVEEVMYGDANGDGIVDTKDAVLLKKYLAGYDDLTIDLTAADTNGDGDVDSKDAVRLLKYLAGYDVQLGE